MATTTVEIFFVGLCSFLNMHDRPDLKLNAPPSVILHRAPGHIPYIAWYENVTALDNAANFHVEKTNKVSFIRLQGEELSINDDDSDDPVVDSNTFDKYVASIGTYGKVGPTPLFDQKHVPLKGQEPDATKEAAYLEFGHGTIDSDWVTYYEYVFADDNQNPSTNPQKYHRRVRYKFDTMDGALVVIARAFDNSMRRKLIFRPKVQGGNVQVWIGNSIDLDYDLDPNPPVTEPVASHFKYFYDDLADKNATKYVPYAPNFQKPSTPKNPPGKGVGTGYCGPDNQP